MGLSGLHNKVLASPVHLIPPRPWTHTPSFEIITVFSGCGKDAAVKFCTHEGFDDATAFEKEESIKEATIYLNQVRTYLQHREKD